MGPVPSHDYNASPLIINSPNQDHIKMCKVLLTAGFRVDTMSKPLLIGSAGVWGKEKGFAKKTTKSSEKNSELAIELDLRRVKKFCRADKGNNIFGCVTCSGLSGDVESFKSVIEKYFKKHSGGMHTIYYTGHGDSDGDWRFPNNGWISFNWVRDTWDKHTKNANRRHLMIVSDCCHSGKWAIRAEGDENCTVMTAAGEECAARDNEFSQVFVACNWDRKRKANIPQYADEQYLKYGGKLCAKGTLRDPDFFYLGDEF